MISEDIESIQFQLRSHKNKRETDWIRHDKGASSDGLFGPFIYSKVLWSLINQKQTWINQRRPLGRPLTNEVTNPAKPKCITDDPVSRLTRLIVSRLTRLIVSSLMLWAGSDCSNWIRLHRKVFKPKINWKLKSGKKHILHQLPTVYLLHTYIHTVVKLPPGDTRTPGHTRRYTPWNLMESHRIPVMAILAFVHINISPQMEWVVF